MIRKTRNLLTFLFLLGLIFGKFPDANNYIEKKSDMSHKKPNDMENFISSSALMPVSITIENNWSATASTYWWCTGTGTKLDPFLIKDIEMFGSSSGILITDSVDYFIIENCTINDISHQKKVMGIMGSNISNGIIRNSNLLYKNNGIYISNGNNLLIEDNSISYSILGIYISDSINCSVKGCTTNNTFSYGIYAYNSTNLSIEQCNISNCINDDLLVGGILLKNSHNNTISETTFSHCNSTGIGLTSSESNNIKKNHFISNTKGIRGYTAKFNHISQNFFNYTGLPIHFDIDSTDNQVINNSMRNQVHFYPDGTIASNVYQGNDYLIPVAKFSYTKNWETVKFTDKSTLGDLPNSYFWDFGDGTNSTAQHTNHTYAASGDFTVSLIVTDANGDNSTYSEIITVTLYSNKDRINGFSPYQLICSGILGLAGLFGIINRKHRTF
jgi:parallel beta-helix repeat protein